MKVKPTILIILDGWGYSPQNDHNAIFHAHTPHWDSCLKTYPHTLVDCSGAAVGLPKGQMGNSEVGHMHMGAGRTIDQDYTRINHAISRGEFNQNQILTSGINTAIMHDRRIHIVGLLSAGGVHSHEDHILALIDRVTSMGSQDFYVHAILDGRDTPPRSAKPSLTKLQDHIDKRGAGKIASIIGRYYAMDRDQRWQRTQQAYELYTQGKGLYHAADPISALEQAYNRNENDEFVQATVTTSDPSMNFQDGDVVIFMNFRADRLRQLAHALVDSQFTHFNRTARPKLADFITLTNYGNDLKAHIAYPPASLKNTFGEVIAQHHLRQLRIAETEKYAHVTYFFNGGKEQSFPKEERILIPSPKVATYDLQPRMSADQLTEQMIEGIKSEQFDVIISNFANADMVGHTGDFDATVKAIECLDQCLGQIFSALKQYGGEILITADHGNAETMYDPKTKQAHTAHTSHEVPFVYIGRKSHICKKTATLIDIAPTMLYLMGIVQPIEMTGSSIIELDR